MGDRRYRDVAGFTGYRVGSDGTVWSRWAYNGHQPRRLGSIWKPLKGQPDGDGYLAVNLFRGGIAHRRKVHLLVLETFVGRRPRGLEARHKNGIAQDCARKNLCWSTKKVNQRDRIKHGTHCRGEQSPVARLTEAVVHQIRSRLAEGEHPMAIAPDVGVSASAIKAIKRGQTWAWLRSTHG